VLSFSVLSFSVLSFSVLSFSVLSFSVLSFSVLRDASLFLGVAREFERERGDEEGRASVALGRLMEGARRACFF
jgi:hypothetical protein